MKRLLIFLAVMLPISVVAQPGHFKLKAKVKYLYKPAIAYLSYRDNGQSIQDSAVSMNGTFVFDGDLTGVTKAVLRLDHGSVDPRSTKPGKSIDALSIYLEKGEISISSTDSIRNGSVSGSPINAQYDDYKKFMFKNEQELEAIRIKWTLAGAKDSTYNKNMEMLYRRGLKQKDSLQRAYLRQHPDSYISGTLVLELAGPLMDLSTAEPLYNGLSQRVKESTVGLELANSIALVKSTSIGMIAPDFTQNDVDGHPVSLSDFRGKYLLLDFWASWCGPCRAENPNVVRVYKRYAQKNFTVLGVSLDRPGKRQDWLAAIKADGLEWTQVSDLKFWGNEVSKKYGLKAIPQNFLIDPAGKIIAKNLTGETLDLKLAEIFEK